HKTQAETRVLKKEEIRDYIQSYWVSEDFDPNDLKSTYISQPFTLFSPRSTFVEKLLEDRFRKHITKTNSTDLISNDNKEFSIPAQYLDLLEFEIFHVRDPLDLTSSKLWERFGQWAGFEKTKKFRHHCRRLWKKTKHAYELHIESLKNPMELYDTPNVFLRHPNDKLFIADETTKKVAGDVLLDGYKYVSKPWCFKNAIGETMIDFFDLDLNNYLIIKIARVVDQYYKHNLSEPSHRSNQFIKDLIEHFGCFTDNNNLPYITSNTASTHSQEHRKCVQDLIRGLQPLSDAVNDYLNNAYPALYTKMEKLNLGPNAPKSFGVFPTISINFNSICQFHRDLKDHRNTLCIVCPLGMFEGGHLAFPELKLAVMAKQGQAIAFRSHLLVHGNLPIITGSRHSVVFYIHDTVIKQKRKFSSLFDGDLVAPEILDNTHSIEDGVKKHDKKLQKYSPPKLAPRNSSKLKNHRRSHLGKGIYHWREVSILYCISTLCLLR
ncbi:1979_t:CDS:1, partial [Ambispora leptoticha]